MECMAQKLWSGLTTAAMLVTSLGIAPVGYANASQPRETDEAQQAHVPRQEAPSNSALAVLPSDSSTPVEPSEGNQADGTIAPASLPDSAVATLSNVRKVGEYQSQAEAQDAAETIVNIYPHVVRGRNAATIHVRSIPVLTLLGGPQAESRASATSRVVTQPGSLQPASYTTSATSGVKLPTPPDESNPDLNLDLSPAGSIATTTQSDAARNSAAASDPVERALAIAARINQLNRDGVDPETITVRWDAAQEQFIIQAGGQDLVAINADTVLPNTTRNFAEDALQATNRLRRLMGDAPPLQEIQGRPRPSIQVSIGAVQMRVSGVASWYGPGFHGNRSASGEVFNQHSLTAAHRSLPFGTQVRVTNLNNGRAVVVRINDRGPFSHGRVIDLSAGAAQLIGLTQSGVAPVSLEVMGQVQAVSAR